MSDGLIDPEAVLGKLYPNVIHSIACGLKVRKAGSVAVSSNLGEKGKLVMKLPLFAGKSHRAYLGENVSLCTFPEHPILGNAKCFH